MHQYCRHHQLVSFTRELASFGISLSYSVKPGNAFNKDSAVNRPPDTLQSRKSKLPFSMCLYLQNRRGTCTVLPRSNPISQHYYWVYPLPYVLYRLYLIALISGYSGSPVLIPSFALACFLSHWKCRDTHHHMNWVERYSINNTRQWSESQCSSTASVQESGTEYQVSTNVPLVWVL